jgi:hypothetical protein
MTTNLQLEMCQLTDLPIRTHRFTASRSEGGPPCCRGNPFVHGAYAAVAQADLDAPRVSAGGARPITGADERARLRLKKCAGNGTHGVLAVLEIIRRHDDRPPRLTRIDVGMSPHISAARLLIGRVLATGILLGENNRVRRAVGKTRGDAVRTEPTPTSSIRRDGGPRPKGVKIASVGRAPVSCHPGRLSVHHARI